MNLGLLEGLLLPAVQRAVASRATARAGPPVRGPTTGMKFDVWVHAARFEDLGGVTPEGARAARHPVRVDSRRRGFAEERPARIHIEITCTGPVHAGVQEICGLIPPPVLLALETMAPPELSGSDGGGVDLRFGDFTAAVASVTSQHIQTDRGAYFIGMVGFQLEGFLHVTLTRRGGIVRPGPTAAAANPPLLLRVVQGPPRSGAGGEHVIVKNAGDTTVQLQGHVLHDGAPRRPHRFVFPALELAPGASVRVWTGKGSADAENLYWGRAKSVWNDTGDLASILSPSGERVVRAGDPGRRGGHK